MAKTISKEDTILVEKYPLDRVPDEPTDLGEIKIASESFGESQKLTSSESLTIRSSFARGQFGEVYDGELTGRSGQRSRVATKIMISGQSKNQFENDEIFAHVLANNQRVSRIPGFARLLGHGKTASGSNFMMFDFAGITLDEFLNSSQSIAPQQAYVMAYQMIRSLGILHASGYTGRDFHARNLVIQSQYLTFIDMDSVTDDDQDGEWSMGIDRKQIARLIARCIAKIDQGFIAHPMTFELEAWLDTVTSQTTQQSLTSLRTLMTKHGIDKVL